MYEHYLFGNFVKSEKPLSRMELEKLFIDADRVSGRMQELPVEKIIDVLDAVAQLWLDRKSPYRKEALKKMPGIVGYSSEMTEIALDNLFENMQRENLYKVMWIDAGKPSYYDRFEYMPQYDGYIRAQPLGRVLHVSPGNVFVGGVDSLMYGFLSKNVNFLKMSRQDPVFPLLFAKSLKEVDEFKYICDSFSILSFSSEDKEVEDFLKNHCDGIVVLGGENAIKQYREGLPLGARLVEYGPRYSFSIITEEGFNEADPREVFKNCAIDVILWEQRACSSPQVIYVEKSIIDTFLARFPEFLEKLGKKFPQENLSMDEKVEILKAREMARFEEAEGNAVLHKAHRSDRWTVIYEDSPNFKISPLNRTIYIKPFSSWADILGQALKIKDYLQTVGILATSGQIKMLSKALSRVGVSRITRIGRMGVGKPGAPHDFDFPIRRLVKWFSIDWLETRFDLGDRIAPAKPMRPRWERLKNLLKFARDNSDFYKKHLQDIDLDRLDNYEVFRNVPMLDKKDIYQNTPPVSDALLTGPLKKAHVFASGGSTGEPKFSFYSFRELDEVSSILADIYQIAGINRNDVVANLFMAGFMWTSFIVVNSALEKIGCVSLPIAGNSELDLILHYMKLFRPTAVVGLPSMIIRLAEEIQKRSLDLTIEKILYGGEHFSPEAIKFLKNSVSARWIHSAGYASVEGGPVGYQMPQDRGGVHRLLYEYMFLEVIDPETLNPVKEGQPGEIVITNFRRRLMPIIRYRTGDVGRILKFRPDSLHRAPLFELLGRVDDVLRIGAMSIYPDKIEEALVKVSGLSHIFQLVGDYYRTKEKLTVRAEALKEGEDYHVLQKKTYETLLESDPELDLVIREGWLGAMEVEILPPGRIEKNPRTGKIKKVVDNRKR